ncbi:related to hydrolase related to dienelactone hydrolase [Cephalotrichum gorgonifer]|uniref:Related to hydrolase related to dienelactone hydrolase n=1 Tax=Cephalotrichum gorgonifer TaxID=2041049 RepID=A0AAE8T064_9PEZI|nr:related to hydrolase related to dienelactone hydrolase [Cephalotrichum gorgonifer]
MASYPPAQCCTLGTKHRGEPTGKAIKLAGKWDGYLATPTEKEHKEVGIVYIPDVLGIWVNSQMMADRFAANGYRCLVVDVFNGDSLPLNRPPDFDMKKWMTQGSDGNNPHTKEAVDPIVEAAIRLMKEELGVKKLGAVGYCFGAKYVARHFSSGIEVGFMAHPSLLEEEELASITGPLSIAAAEVDYIFPAEKRHKSEQILAKIGLPYQINLYSGVIHGFAVRCDPRKKAERYAREQAFLQALAWFGEHLL